MGKRVPDAAGSALTSRDSLAVATLLRLAEAGLRDAVLLATGPHVGNAPVLAGWAVARMVDAVVVTETGWQPGGAGGNLALVPAENPLKPELSAILARLPAPGLPVLLAGGRPPFGPDRQSLRTDLDAARILLEDLAARFDVDLAGSGPAGRVAPVRPEPPPPPLPPRHRPDGSAPVHPSSHQPRSSAHPARLGWSCGAVLNPRCNGRSGPPTRFP